jgi:catechol 2,3-dioxygenase-like lactoylglutathione lyase family enzyme
MEKLTVEGIEHVGLYCRDLKRTARWYQEILQCEVVEEDPFHVTLALGGQKIALFEAAVDSLTQGGLHHIALRVAPDKRATYERTLDLYGIRLHDFGPNRGFQDPDGHWLHLV